MLKVVTDAFREIGKFNLLQGNCGFPEAAAKASHGNVDVFVTDQGPGNESRTRKAQFERCGSTPIKHIDYRRFDLEPVHERTRVIVNLLSDIQGYLEYAWTNEACIPRSFRIGPAGRDRTPPANPPLVFIKPKVAGGQMGWHQLAHDLANLANV